VRKHLEIAARFLKSSKILLEDGDLRSAVDRAYYAMYHATQAIIAWKKIRPPKTHKGLREVFGKEIILEGIADKELEKYLTKGFEMRQSSTYKLYVDFGREGVRKLIEDAEEFVERIRDLIGIG
jgi:uncharacterized protein (UPF0332 family)